MRTLTASHRKKDREDVKCGNNGQFRIRACTHALRINKPTYCLQALDQSHCCVLMLVVLTYAPHSYMSIRGARMFLECAQMTVLVCAWFLLHSAWAGFAWCVVCPYRFMKYVRARSYSIPRVYSFSASD